MALEKRCQQNVGSHEEDRQVYMMEQCGERRNLRVQWGKARMSNQCTLISLMEAWRPEVPKPLNLGIKSGAEKRSLASQSIYVAVWLQSLPLPYQYTEDLCSRN